MVSNGLVVATGFGTAVVIAIAEDGGFMASCTVVVEKETIYVSSIELSHTSATISKGKTMQLYATVLPNDATDKTLIWRSSDETVCVVTQSGMLIAMNEGTAVVKVNPKNGDGLAQCEVTVVDIPTGIQDVQSDSQSHENCIYDVMGRKVSQLMKGHLYIINGRKVIVK